MLTRAIVFFFGLMMLSIGIAVVTHAGLGTGTISSVALVMTHVFPLTLGVFVFLTNVFFFAIQIAVDRSNFWVKFFKQIPVCLAFGLFIDAAYWASSFLTPQTYVARFLCVLCGTVFTGCGIAGMVFSRLAVLPPEGLVLSVIHRWGGSFGNLRTLVDVFLVVTALSLSWLALGEIVGVREGTFVAALLGGQFAKLFLKALGRLLPQHRTLD